MYRKACRASMSDCQVVYDLSIAEDIDFGRRSHRE